MKQNFTVRRGAIDGVEVFLNVARHRSFRRAAAQLGVTPSAVSQSIRALEVRVGVPLLIRTTRTVGLTEAGERFLSRAQPAFDELVAASQAARELSGRPSGRLRLSVPRAAVSLILEPLVASFCQAYPEVEVELSASDELADVAAEGFDAGIRVGQFIAADMIAVRLTPSFRRAVVANAEYLDRHGRPMTPNHLREHSCLRLRRSDGTLAPWVFEDGGADINIEVAGPLIANDVSTLLGAASQGMGLAQLPAPIVAEHVRSGILEDVLSEFASTAPGLFLYYPDRRQVLPKLRAFIDHMKQRQSGQMTSTSDRA